MKVLPLAIIGTVIGVVISVLLIVSRTLPVRASEQAANIDYLYVFFLAFSGIIFAIVTLFLLVAVYRFRARPNDQREGKNVHGITWLEVLWTAIPFVIVLACGVAGWYVLAKDDVYAAGAKEGQKIHIVGYQFGWKFDYLNADIALTEQDELVVPVGEPIAFDLTSNDVMHAFWVPAWRFQMSALPTQTNYASVTPSKIGTYDVVCAYLCGVGHTGMNSAVEGSIIPKVRVVSAADFETWVAERKAEAAQEAEQADQTTTAEAA
ncbi:MAG: cytochrome c oxidase subunit II [Actinomycetota bacterium]